MPFSAKILIGTGAVVCVFCLIAMIKSGHFFKSLSVSAISGIGSLFAVNLLSGITGFGISVNWFTVIFSAFSGICGSIALLISNVLV